jgi:hypothetical protein
VRVWDARTGERIGGFEAEGPEKVLNLSGLAVAPDGKHAALTLLDQVVVVELAGGKVVWRAKSRGGHVAFSPDGRLLASAG